MNQGMSVSGRVKLAVAGGQRGAAFLGAMAALQDRVELTAICDRRQEVLDRWRADHPDIQTFLSYDELLDKGECSAVFVATPMDLHARQAIQALEAGKHVLSEVIAATAMDECWHLVEAVENSGLTYMLAENYCYMRSNMMVLHMVQRGLFGELTYAEGAYIHDCRDLIFKDEHTLTWRGEERRLINGNTYPTHSLGPVAQWLGVNRPAGDRLVSTATWMSPAKSVAAYARDRFGPDHPAAQEGYWVRGDSATTVIHTEKGVVIVLRFDSNSSRPHQMAHYALQGTRGAYVTSPLRDGSPLIWIDGRSPGHSPGDAEWESLWNYGDEYEHPSWREWRGQADGAGHGGGDFFIIKDFVEAIQTGRRPAIDVYDAATWSSIMPLSVQSVAHGSIPVDIPDFSRRRP